MVDIIHFCSKYHPFNGNIFYHFEYYIFLLQRYVDVRLHIISNGPSLEQILEVMDDRYDIDYLDYKDNIIYYKNDIPTQFFKNVITNSKTVFDLDGKITAEHIHMVHTWASCIGGFKEKICKFLHYNDIIEYNESPLCGEVNYTRPIYFNILKPVSIISTNVYLHLCGVRNIKMRDFLEHVLPLVKGKKIMVSYPEHQSKEMEYLNKINFVETYINHIPDLFNKFGTYFYIMLDSIDYSPRMLIECAYLGKEIIYLDKTGVLHGGYTRYKDIQDRNIDKYQMTEDDKLLKNFI